MRRSCWIQAKHVQADAAVWQGGSVYFVCQNLTWSFQALELAINYTQLFHAKRNRVEIISDFPDGNDAEVLSSLRLHPQGWVALSRNTSSDEGSEWCCVHDIQSLPTQPEEDQAVGERPPLTWRSGGVPRARPSAPVVQVTCEIFIGVR